MCDRNVRNVVLLVKDYVKDAEHIPENVNAQDDYCKKNMDISVILPQVLMHQNTPKVPQIHHLLVTVAATAVNKRE